MFKRHELEKEITALSFVPGGIAPTKFALGNFCENLQLIPDEIITYITAIRNDMRNE